jgi:uncharacterized membrane protein YciS (DUF1049 family)
MAALRRLLLLLLLAAILFAAWRFGVRNAEPVTVYAFVGEFSGVALWAALASAFALGAAVMGLLAAFQLAKTGLLARRYRRALAGLEAEVHQLRNLPLSPDENAPGDETRALAEGTPRKGRGT